MNNPSKLNSRVIFNGHIYRFDFICQFTRARILTKENNGILFFLFTQSTSQISPSCKTATLYKRFSYISKEESNHNCKKPTRQAIDGIIFTTFRKSSWTNDTDIPNGSQRFSLDAIIHVGFSR